MRSTPFSLLAPLAELCFSAGGDRDYSCSQLNSPSYGALVFNGAEVPVYQQPSWRDNDTVTIVCAQGYRLFGSSNTSLGTQRNITCRAPDGSGSGSGSTTSTGDGRWSEDPEDFRCSTQVTVCSDPPTISNGARTWTAGEPAQVGTTVDYTCDSGYELDGATVITCDINGNWTSPPTCSGSAVLSSTEIYIVEGAGAAILFLILSVALCLVSCLVCRIKIKQRQYIEDEEALAKSGAFTLSNPLVKDEDAAGNPLYLTPDELNEFEQQQ
jgi:hypothetical protein